MRDAALRKRADIAQRAPGPPLHEFAGSGTMLTLIYRQFEGFENALTQQVAAYRQVRPDADISLTSLDVQPLYERMVAGGGAKRGDADLFMAVTDWLPELIRDGHIDCLDEYLANDPPPDWPNGWTDSVLALQRDANGRVYGMPYHDGPE